VFFKYLKIHEFHRILNVQVPNSQSTAARDTYLQRATGTTVDLATERMTDDYVSVHGERENQQLAEVLRQEEEHVEHLAGDR